MGNVQRVLLQVGTALAFVYLGIWIYRNPRKTLLLYGDLANQSSPQKFVMLLGSLCMFVGAYAVVVVCVGQYLPDIIAGLIAAATGIAVVWCVKRITRTQSR
jgi:L-lactate permease